MKIEPDTHVSIDYTLKLDSGETIDQSEAGEPLGFIFGRGQMVPGLERRLAGMEQGQQAEMVVEAAEAYGEHREELLSELPRTNFPEGADLRAGMTFTAETPHGPVRFQVREVRDEDVVADFNHPLAGERLHFGVTVALVREATPEELAATDSCGKHDDCSHCGGH